VLELSSIPETPDHPVTMLTRITLLFISGPLLALLVSFPCLAIPGSAWSSPNRSPGVTRKIQSPAIAVEDRLRRLQSIPSMPEEARWACQREIWIDFRTHARQWFPSLARHVLRETDPLREEAILALRCFGTEQPWEHREHSGRSPCLLGFEPKREQAEVLLTEIVTHERGRARQYALLSLSCYRTGSSVACLMDSLCEDENCELVDESLRWILSGVGMPALAPDSCGWAGPAGPSTRALKVKCWQTWWKGALDGRNEFPATGTLAEPNPYWK
jgi:hypothetical protein